MRNRGSVVIVENNRIALMKRIKDGEIYYVFPGGGIEDGETPEVCAKREAFEELGVVVKVNACIAKVEFQGLQYFFLSEILCGAFGTGRGEEYKAKDRGTYLPIWINIAELSSINVKPIEVAKKVQSLFL